MKNKLIAFTCLSLVLFGGVVSLKSYLYRKHMKRISKEVFPLMRKGLDRLTREVVTPAYVRIKGDSLIVYMNYNMDGSKMRYSVDAKENIRRALVKKLDIWKLKSEDFKKKNMEISFTDDIVD